MASVPGFLYSGRSSEHIYIPKLSIINFRASSMLYSSSAR